MTEPFCGTIDSTFYRNSIFEYILYSQSKCSNMRITKLVSYMAGAEAQDIMEHGNNNSRWMIEGIRPNFNKTEKKIYLQLRETDYCTTSCVWQAWAKDDPVMEK